MASSSVKILYLDPAFAISGAERSLQLLLRALSKLGPYHPLAVLRAPGPLRDQLNRDGIETYTMPLAQLKARNPLPYLKTVYQLAYLMSIRKVDLVHCNMDICNQYALPAARLNRIPVVTHTRNILGRRAFRRMFLGFADVLVANSHAVAASYDAYRRSSQRVEVIYNGVDCQEFSPTANDNAFRRALGLGERMFIIGVVARIHPCKGQEIFIRALAEIVRAHPQVRGLVVGDTQVDSSQWFLDDLRRLTGELGITDKVIFTGFVENMVEVYASLDLVVLPASNEPFGRTLIEAMAMEKPVVASAVGGPLEVVADGKTGLLVPPSNSTALAGAMMKLIRSPEMAQAMGQRGRQRVQEMFSIDRHVERMEEIYTEVLSCGQCRTRISASR